MNAASAGAQKLLESHEELLRLQHERDFLAVMSTPEGRRFVWGLLGDAGVYRQSFESDSMATAFNEGMRAGGLRILARLNDEAPELYLKAQSESIEAKKVHQQLVAAAEAEAAREQEEDE